MRIINRKGSGTVNCEIQEVVETVEDIQGGPWKIVKQGLRL